MGECSIYGIKMHNLLRISQRLTEDIDYLVLFFLTQIHPLTE